MGVPHPVKKSYPFLATSLREYPFRPVVISLKSDEYLLLFPIL